MFQSIFYFSDDYHRIVGLSGGAKSKKSKAKMKVSKVMLQPDMMDTMEFMKDEKSFDLPKVVLSDLEPGIQILAMYDSCDNLIKLTFDRNRAIPRIIFKIIGLIVQFHYYLHTLVINRGLDKYCVYEISKFLPYSRISDLCLDNCAIPQANYYLLLENCSHLRHLSLARCSINDDVIETIVANLTYPMPSSRTLSVLNLATNKITDVGAKILAEMLRSNRQLSYLNLSDNMLTDVGVEQLLHTLVQFPLTFAELLASRSRHMNYMKEKNAMVLRMVNELRAMDFEKRSAKRRSVSSRPQSMKKKGLEKEVSLKSLAESKSLPNMEVIFIDRATVMAEKALGEFYDPYDKSVTVSKDGIVYSQGNNSLAYLGLAYNNLTFMSVKKLLKVLVYQRDLGRKPRGLVNVSIEGNLLPVTCVELAQIDKLLESGLMMHSRRYSLPKKRILPKTSGGR